MVVKIQIIKMKILLINKIMKIPNNQIDMMIKLKNQKKNSPQIRMIKEKRRKNKQMILPAIQANLSNNKGSNIHSHKKINNNNNNNYHLRAKKEGKRAKIMTS